MKRFRFLLAASVVAGASSVCVHSLQADDDDNQRGDRVARMMNLDKDDDGKISKAETPERLAGLFAKADTDEDGFLTEAEVKNAMAGSEGQANDGQRGRGRGDRAEGGRPGDERGRGPGGEGRGRERGERGGERGEQQGRGGERDSDRRPDGPSESVLMGAIDADGNGQLSEEEIKNAVTAIKALDRNEDGMLDAVELRASRRSPEGRGGEGRGGEGRGGEGRGGEGRGGEGRGDRGRGGQGPGDRGGEGRGDQGRGDQGRGDQGRGDQGRGDQGRGREGDRPSPDSFAAMMIERMDKDDDGKLKGDEIPERMAGRLADIDKNDDKAIDKAELAAMAEQMFRGRERGGDRESGSRANGRRPGGDRPQRPDGAGSSEDRGGQRPKRPASDDDIT